MFQLHLETGILFSIARVPIAHDNGTRAIGKERRREWTQSICCQVHWAERGKGEAIDQREAGLNSTFWSENTV